MPSIKQDLTDPSGMPITDARITARLITRADRAEAPGYYQGKQIVGLWKTTSEGVDDTPGRWILTDLIANDDADLSPADTYYLLTTTVPGRKTITETVFVPAEPADGEHWVGDILHVP